MVLTVSFVLSPVTGLSCHRRSRWLPSENLTPASGRQDHTTSPSASAPLVLRRQSVHRIPRPTSVTIAIRPLVRRDVGINNADFSEAQSGIFFELGLDTRFVRRLVDLPGGLTAGEDALGWPLLPNDHCETHDNFEAPGMILH